MEGEPLTVYQLAKDLYNSTTRGGSNAITDKLPCRQFLCDSLNQTVSDEPGRPKEVNSYIPYLSKLGE